ncbi:MAG: hypothetical protein K6B12_03365, partial [Clostridiales bacterium]|nr:hypothetical protein [Clostridiales bacterium]
MNTNPSTQKNANDEPFVVVIPAYKPDKKLLVLLDQLRIRGFDRIIVVDDGSGQDYQTIFTEAASLGAEIL